MTPRISVALGTRNGAAYLADQLGSVLAQSTAVDEVVLSDDDSSDDTVALAERLIATHRDRGGRTELRVLRNSPALGVTANFEQALRAATGDLIALCDQDDVWRSDRIAAAVARFEADPDLQLVASDARLVDAQGEPLPHTLFDTLGVDAALRARFAGGGATDEMLKRNILTGATMMVRRELVELAVPFPASWVHDEWLGIVAAASGGALILEEPLIDYRQHGANEIGVTKLSLDGKLGRLRQPRTNRDARLLSRADDLHARAGGFADAAFVAATAEKLEHERVRSALPAARPARIAPVLREARTGRYSRYGLGAQDILRDLVQPV